MRQVIKSGNSLAVTIPKKFVEALGIKKGDKVKPEARPDKGVLIYHFQGVQQLPISELVFRSRSAKTHSS